MPYDRTYTQSKFRGQVHSPAPVTPFNERGELMLDAFQEVLRFHLDTSADTMLIAGDNGEGYALSDAELKLVVETALRTIRGRIPFFVHVNRLSTKESQRRAEIARDAGAPGICLQPAPYLARYTLAEIVQRFETVSKAVPLPMMVYNNPRHAGVNIEVDVIKAISDACPVVIYKEGNGEIDHFTRMFKAVGHRYPVLIGWARSLLPALLLGSGGFVSTGAELLGKEARRLLDVHTMTPEERFDFHWRLGEVISACSFFGTSPSGMKAALNLMGIPAGVPREPVLPLDAVATEKLRRVLVECGILEGNRVAARVGIAAE
jgi:4-hydroxy-tetrahydrodipicolinate synthase